MVQFLKGWGMPYLLLWSRPLKNLAIGNSDNFVRILNVFFYKMVAICKDVKSHWKPRPFVNQPLFDHLKYFRYPLQWDLNTNHLNTWIMNFLKFRFQMVWYWNVWSNVQWTRPTIQMLYQYMRKQDGVHLFGIQMAFKNQTIWHPTTFDHSNTRLVRYSDPHFIYNLVFF